MLKGVIFDLDGTLTEFTLDYVSAREEIVDFLLERGIRIGSAARRITDVLDEAHERLKRGDKASEFSEIKRIAYKKVAKYEHEAALKTKLHPGAIEVLEKVRGMGLKVAVVTNNNRSVVDMLLGRLGIEHFFDVVICREDVSEYKPKPDSIRKAVEEMGIRAEEAVCVGDSSIDVEASRRAGVLCIAVPIGVAKVDDLRRHNPDYLAGDLFEVMGIVEELYGSQMSPGE
ncbi:MAG: HAD family hydrolase [Candidatus Geothermarchaeales archaeon]